MQGPGRNEIVERVKIQLSKKLKLSYCKFHDYVNRVKLITKIGYYKDYELMRVKVEYNYRREKISKNIIIYPSDVIRYVRKTLDVIEEISREKIVNTKSYLELEEIHDNRCEGFSLNSIKSAIKRAVLAFERLMSSGMVEVGVIGFSSWLKTESRNFSELNIDYFRQYFLMDIIKEQVSLFNY